MHETYEPFEKKLQRVDKVAMDLLFAISDGSKTDMDSWAGTELFGFFTALWARDDSIKKQIERIEASKNKK